MNPEKAKEQFADRDDRLAHFSVKTIDTQELALAKALETLSAKFTDPKERGLFDNEMEGYLELFRRFKSNRGKLIEWEKIKVDFAFSLSIEDR
jgi:hypothetical protein